MSVQQTVSFYLDNVGSHAQKKSTPSMGGLVILIASFSSFLFFYSKELNSIAILILCSGACFGLLGFFDDYKKVTSKQHFGLLIKVRFLLEIAMGIIIMIIANKIHGSNNNYTNTLIIGNYKINSIILYSIVRVIAIIGAANGVNITDGLDGLVSFPLILCFGFFGILSFLVSTNPYILKNQQFIADIGIITPLCISLIGAILGFLYYNTKPSKIFMGDTGSLALGGMLGSIAVITKGEILLIIAGILFVIETISCILQIISFKFFKKRIFLIAPIHHHFEKKGLQETTIVIRAWIFSIVGISVALGMI